MTVLILGIKKTFNPPRELPYTDDVLLRAWLVGYIDGDGYLYKQTGRKSAALQTVAHISWESFLKDVVEKLDFGHIFYRYYSEDKSYVCIVSQKHGELVDLKLFARSHNLPVLERKWIKVDELLVVRPARDGSVKREIERLIRQKMSNKEISLITGHSPSMISGIRSKMID